MFQIHYPQENFFSIINANFTGIPPEDSESGIPEDGGGTDRYIVELVSKAGS